jgi:hypothetical protein
VQTENITGCRHVYFEHIAIIVVDFFFLIRIRPSGITPKTAVVILGCFFPAFNSSVVVLLFDVITTFAPARKVMISCYIWYQVCSFCWLRYHWQIKDINNLLIA